MTNVVNRTTSETLRIGENEQNSLTITSSSVANNRKKPCSFQITSVIVGRNNDGGDDSADDLDDISHADDISDVVDVSRITDNETPSLSEDTISKEDIFYNVSGPMSLCSAPVIPTSSQYGLVIVSPGGEADPTAPGASVAGSGLGAPPFSVPPEQVIIHGEQGTNKPLNANEHDHAGGKEGTQPVRADRFKVVKIESTEPFKRGRWTCMDFLDSVNMPFSVAISQGSNAATNTSSSVPHHPQVAQSLPQEVLQANQSQTQVQYYPATAQQPVTSTSQPFPVAQQGSTSSVPQQYPVQMQAPIMSTPSSYSVQQPTVPQHNVLQQQANMTHPPVSIPSSVQPAVYNQSGRYATYTTQSSKSSAQGQYVTPVTYSQSYVASPGSQASFMPQGQTYAGHLSQAIASVQQGQTYAGHAYQMSKTNYTQPVPYQQQAPQPTAATSTAGGVYQYVNQPVYGQGYNANIPSSPVSVPQQAPAYPNVAPPTTQASGEMHPGYVATNEHFQPGVPPFSMAQPLQQQSVSSYVQPVVQPEEPPPSVKSETRETPPVSEEGQANPPLPDEADT